MQQHLTYDGSDMLQCLQKGGKMEQTNEIICDLYVKV